MTLRYLELFAGAGGLSRGLEASGMVAVAHAEIEPHARAVLRQHWPTVALHGDVAQLDGTQYVGQVDVVAGGSPCQDLSVAGKRAGLAGARSGLFFEQVRIWEETQAPYLIWENVAGALSSNRGADFAAVLSALVGAAVPVPRDGWRGAGVASGTTGVAAWRMLDLQHFGPPQRRRRIFVVAARTGGVDPAEVLALSEGVCGHPAPREQSRQAAPGGAGAGAGSGSIAWDNELNASVERHGPLLARGKSGGDRNGVLAFSTTQTPKVGGDVALTLEAASRSGGGQTPAVIAFHHTQDPVSGAVSPTIGRPTDGMGVFCATGDVTHALTHEGADASEDGTGRGTPIVGIDLAPTLEGADVLNALPASLANSATGHNRDELVIAQHGQYNATFDTTVAPTLTCLHEQPYLVKTEGREWPKPIADTLTVAYAEKWGLEDQHINSGAGLFQPTATGSPRRLTPKECERLMSWPDDWTAVGVGEGGKTYRLSDTARYRLCGNGVGSVCVSWFAARLVAMEAECPR